ncbi:hypothetical protein T484DRAFT_1881123 [Baffinella frigidus]|nr:hypothetical protein T484DRAFT_1881123 [Cryptophyta sp. CCMP2293]
MGRGLPEPLPSYLVSPSKRWNDGHHRGQAARGQQSQPGSSLRLEMLDERLKALEMDDWRAERLLRDHDSILGDSSRPEASEASPPVDLLPPASHRRAPPAAASPARAPHAPTVYASPVSASRANGGGGGAPVSASRANGGGGGALDGSFSSWTPTILNNSAHSALDFPSPARLPEARASLLSPSRAPPPRVGSPEPPSEKRSAPGRDSAAEEGGAGGGRAGGDSQAASGLAQNSGFDAGSAQKNSGAQQPPGARESRAALAQQLLDALLGQYFARAASVQALVAAGARGEEGEVAWGGWWEGLEAEVRGAIKGEIKAVFDHRCTDLFQRARAHLRALFQAHGQGPERALTLEQLRQGTDAGVWTLYSSQADALDPDGDRGAGGEGSAAPYTWEGFWEGGEAVMRMAVKMHMKKVVKSEMQGKFSEWRQKLEAAVQLEMRRGGGSGGGQGGARGGGLSPSELLRALRASPLAAYLDAPA